MGGGGRGDFREEGGSSNLSNRGSYSFNEAYNCKLCSPTDSETMSPGTRSLASTSMRRPERYTAACGGASFDKAAWEAWGEG